ncbi:hypothetical protein BRE01_09790 [Brevibacillus reuszeri]|uniref:DUF4097 domain-containing protein n=1 Tax=Brevibacillus reuszeri TaxID=54915 RepID=A0A0K9YTT7_9BACL|nr:DUF4097 family beta strand repeat-containing protein [Brevibacillus reuszeri]KNB71610.1 hypothetical protein ADS79_22895 [Brevibacillus reuszeri]MED1855571.1 DUF4097 family beta strand repeat-containing protein [Brevibacillus reuszeri]GED67277.1 hypothetical protein BRE01_09790 [Brevibacillus reuszeri]
MKRWIGVGLLIAALSLAGCSSLEMEESKRQLELPMDSIEALDIQTESGDLIVKGDEKATSIKVEATIKKSKSVPDEDITVTLEKDGNTAKLVSKTKGGFGVRITDITLNVTIPAKLNVDVNDGSGDLDISNLAGVLTIEDDSGDIKINDVSGEVVINDGSGDIKIKNASALKQINDESGDIFLENTGGNVDIQDDSGDIVIRNHTGDITISDGSGDMVIDTIQGNVTITEDGSGDRMVKNVSGSFIAN